MILNNIFCSKNKTKFPALAAGFLLFLAACSNDQPQTNSDLSMQVKEKKISRSNLPNEQSLLPPLPENYLNRIDKSSSCFPAFIEEANIGLEAYLIKSPYVEDIKYKISILRSENNLHLYDMVGEFDSTDVIFPRQYETLYGLITTSMSGRTFRIDYVPTKPPTVEILRQQRPGDVLKFSGYSMDDRREGDTNSQHLTEFELRFDGCSSIIFDNIKYATAIWTFAVKVTNVDTFLGVSTEETVGHSLELSEDFGWFLGRTNDGQTVYNLSLSDKPDNF